ncbi:TonB-dependent receptor [Hephaestia sp. GCM10023244]|uniref:TonB-dependent receptor n=1 Tax=unclassified Hephaestia TaxID=2631281 RepID=UPI0020778AC3|nr:TonB-dependent receptor [Hephaestia sp. MAHUQ-44]MCM8732459.1 TonB-dependent receptor [Hephaestia sp. MAHUQ-44]
MTTRVTRRILATTTALLGASCWAMPAMAQDQAAASVQTDADDAAPADIVVVGSIRQSLEAAAEIKRESLDIVDSVVAEDIGKFPDPSTAAALQRIPGVQTDVGADNEIGGVRIRGLNDISTTLDGREIFSTTGRNFNFQDLPSTALGRVDVYKTSNASLIEGGIVGSVDLHLNKPFKFRKPTIVGLARANYSVNQSRVDPQFSVLATDRWDTGIGEIGALVNVSWRRSQWDRPYLYQAVRRSTAIAPFNLPGLISNNVAGGVAQYGVFERPQVNAAFQWQASPSLQIYLDGLYTGYKSDQQSGFVEAQLYNTGTTISDIAVGDRCFTALVNPNGYNANKQQIGAGNYTTQDLCEIDSATYSNATAFSSSQARFQTRNNYLVGGGFIFDRGPGHLKADFAYQKSDFINEGFVVDIGKRVPEVIVEANAGIGGRFTFTGNPLNDPDGYVFRNGLNQNFQHDVGELFQARIDGSFDIVSNVLSKIQYGLRFANRSAVSDQGLVNKLAPGGDIGGAGGDKGTLISSTGLPADFLSETPGIPRLNEGAPWLTPNPDYLRSESGRDLIRGIFGVPLGSPPYDPERRFVAREKTMAAYLQLRYKLDVGGPIRIDGVVGVRPTVTDRRIEGAGVVSGVVSPRVAKTSDFVLLPSAAMRVRFDSGLQARFAYSEAIRRPEFGQLNPGISYQINGNPNVQNGGNAGNPNLRMQKSESFDATLEYYFHRGFFAIGAYHRAISNRVISGAALEMIDGIGYNISRPRNVGSVTLKGIETGGQAFLDFLPGALSGLGVQANFTYADSKVGGEDVLAGYPLQGVSKYNFNAGLLYEKYGISGRLIYNYRSSYFDQNTTGLTLVRPVTEEQLADGTVPVNLGMVRPAGRLDFSIGYEITDRIRVDVGGSNILRNKYRSYFDEPGFNRDIRWDDAIYTAGIRVRL